MPKPTYEELAQLVKSLYEMDCSGQWPERCWNPETGDICVLFEGGYCKEIEEMYKRLEEAEEEDEETF